MLIPAVSFYQNISKAYGIDIPSLFKKLINLLTVSHTELLEPYLLDQVQQNYLYL